MPAAPTISLTDLDTAELLARIGCGDSPAWIEIVRRYGGLVEATVRVFRFQDADAADAVQNTWVRFAEHVHRLRSADRLGGWLRTVARRECLAIVRQRRAAGGSDALEFVADGAPGPEDRLIAAETAIQVRGAVARLPEPRRRLLRQLFADEPLPYTDIARASGIAVGSIGPTRARALTALRRDLQHRPVAAKPRSRSSAA